MIKKVNKTEDKSEPSFAGIPPTIEKVSQELSCELNDVEWQNRARELADAHRETTSQETRKTAIVAELNADIKAAKAKENKLANIVSNRHEQREVTVEVTKDYETGFVTQRRTDTNEEISKREMTTLERQGSLLDANDFIEDRAQ